MLNLMEIASAPINRVAVIDDDELGREMLLDDLRDRDFEPVAIDGAYGQDIDRMVGDILAQKPQFVICDHRLQAGGMASFFGLNVVQKLLDVRSPAMLVTQYSSTDSTKLQLRKARHSIPLVMARDAFILDDLPAYADMVLRELSGSPVDERKPHRTLIQIEFVDPKTGNVDALVPSWSPKHALTIPIDCFSAPVRDRLTAGDFVLGDVNIGARSEEDLFFKNLDEIVTPNPLDGLS